MERARVLWSIRCMFVKSVLAMGRWWRSGLDIVGGVGGGFRAEEFMCMVLRVFGVFGRWMGELIL